MLVSKNSNYARAVLLAALALGIGMPAPALADGKNPPLPERIADLPDKLIKYEHRKNMRASDGKRYDIKIQYGRSSYKRGLAIQPRRIIAFTRVLIRPAGKGDYTKPSADRLSELFPGSMVYTSINGALVQESALGTGDTCAKKKWHKSREFTTFVSLNRIVCNGKGFDTGHRAKIGNQMVVDRKL